MLSRIHRESHKSRLVLIFAQAPNARRSTSQIRANPDDFRPTVKEIVERYLDCGGPRSGFARIRCPDCQTEHLLTFSVDLTEHRIRVQKTKSGEMRYININTPLLEVLRSLKSRNGQTLYVFFDQRTGRPLKRIDRAFGTARRKAGIADLRFYDLRHTFASRLIHAGADIEIVKSLLGHSSITSPSGTSTPTMK